MKKQDIGKAEASENGVLRIFFPMKASQVLIQTDHLYHSKSEICQRSS